ncbi:MAG: hypothetical protein KGH54_02010 [Candidatus Micrarchaeota archaeon]|nr:hypothetical protein [Candidatus Micrarchaeota archaeon]
MATVQKLGAAQFSEFEKGLECSLEYNRSVVSTIRLDYTDRRGYTYRINGDFGEIGRDGNISMPMLRRHNDTSQLSYILSIKTDGRGVFGQIRDMQSGKPTECLSLDDPRNFIIYTEKVSHGLGLMANVARKAGRRNGFTVEHKVEILDAVARTSVGVSVISSMIIRALKENPKSPNFKHGKPISEETMKLFKRE